LGNSNNNTSNTFNIGIAPSSITSSISFVNISISN
jgi:hypothetical protein